MVKYHQKSISVPKSWPIRRKKNVFVTRPLPSGHNKMNSMPLSVFMKDIIKCAHTQKEAKNIVNTKEVLVDGKRRKSVKIAVGLMDVISFPQLKESYRVILTKKGKLSIIKIDEKENNVKPCKIVGKTVIKKGKCQLNLSDGKNINLTPKESYKVGETVMISLPKQEVTKHYKLEKGASVFLTGGKKIGQVVTIEEIKGDIIIFSNEEGKFETAKRYAFVVGKNKPEIKLSE